MKRLISAAFKRSRTTLLLLAVLLLAGLFAWITLPREASPEIDVPYFFVTAVYPGVGAEDAERLLLEPLERELQTLEGLEQLEGWAGEGFAQLQLEFSPSVSNRAALADVREKVDLAEPDLPTDVEPVRVEEVDLSLFPILTVGLSGPVSERLLNELARQAQDRLETLPGVLEVVIGGEREEMMEVLVDPLTLESYQLNQRELLQALDRNNLVVAAGAMDTGNGRVALRIPGTVRNAEDILDTPLRAADGTLVTMADVAEVRRTFVDPTGFARVNGTGALSLEIRKTQGANIIDTVRQAQSTLRDLQAQWPSSISLTPLQNQAEDVSTLLRDLENSVLVATLLVLAVLVLALGPGAAWLVALAIPASFLVGLLGIALLGFTLNIVVLFSLILVVGMLVDGALVVTELADRELASGRDRWQAFQAAAQRMAWPITASIATTLAVFLPMLFWPGIVGRFIGYLPATVSITLLASLLMALCFIPVLGGLLGPRRPADPQGLARVRAAETGEFGALSAGTRRYLSVLRWCIQRPGRTSALTVALAITLFGLYAGLGRGVEFFPDVEPDFVQLQVQARGNLSVWEADQLVRRVETAVAGTPGVASSYTRTLGDARARLASNLADDVVGIIRLDLADWRQRPAMDALMADLRARAATVAGVRVQIESQQRGPGSARPVVVEISGDDRQALAATVRELREQMRELGGFEDISDDRSVPRVDLEWVVDRSELGRYGADLAHFGQSLQLLTNGVLLGTMRPPELDDEIDIRLRFPRADRNLAQLANLHLITREGPVPVSNFARLEPTPSPGLLRRVDGRPAYTLESDVATGFLADERIRALRAELDALELPAGVKVRFRGQAEDQSEAGNFLVAAFLASMLLMATVLVTQFNSLRQTLLVMSAIVFSTAGVLLGLLLRMEPFSVVMSGVSLLAIAGIVVNNNIVLLDTYNQLRAEGIAPADAALRTGAQRMRPVLLTAITTLLGLLPMVLALTIDIPGRDFHVGAPSTQFWVQLATGIAGGLVVATPVTLLFTPAVAAWLEAPSAAHEQGAAKSDANL